ncbi:MAG: YceI family protein [Saprospiraceae bacterium]
MKKLAFVFFALSIGLMGSAFIKSNKMKVDVAKSKIMWTGKKVTGQHSGTIALKSGEVNFDNGRPISGSFEVDMKSMKSTDLQGEYADKLIGHLKSDDFFGVDKYPTVSFMMKNATATVDPKVFLVTGDLTIKGITQSISFDAKFDQQMASAKLDIDRTKFNIKYGSGSFFDNLGDKAIDNMFQLDVQLTFMK